MAQKNALGKGLGAIFPDLLDDKKNSAVTCGIEELHPSPNQPRKNFNTEDQKQLVASVKASGIIQPIVVRKSVRGYEIIAGERRWRAAQAAGLQDVPIVIREATDSQAAEWTLVENLQRQDLNPLEEADGYVTLMEKFNLSQEQISARVGKDRSTIANTIRLLKLPAKVKTALVEKKISSGHARCLLAFNNAQEQITVLDLIIKKDLNVRATERLMQKAKNQTVPKKAVTSDRHLLELEKNLAAKFMAKVHIRGTAKKGTIELRYTSLDELNRLARLILDDLQ
ncbi:MAG TPA: ParB/RepB/Spo0J family partition protein [Smithellaceae bacterium]|nr:ParB/RepB/Spo0J family partition protein [Smithellaceae bacterium]